MNHWIERHIIFPKINELKLKEEKVKQEDQIRISIIKQLKRNKSNSLYSLKDGQIEERSKNYSGHRSKARASPIRKAKKNSLPFHSKQHLDVLDETNEHQGVKYINIIQLLEERKHSFDSSPLKNMLRKIKYQQQQERNSLKKISEIQYENGRSLKKRYIKSKLLKSKTEPQQQIIKHYQKEHYEKGCLQIKKMTRFDYHVFGRELQAEKESKRKSFLKKKQLHQLKQTRLKITSIKGWKNEFEDAANIFD